ncbi:unnamed protein product [Orchesella dallaii]|uniref:F-box domain-containing protein n=1 Tax=Orchesella dallaii TaxID=48710 RepID=A0ABP1S9C8_9HEXA
MDGKVGRGHEFSHCKSTVTVVEETETGGDEHAETRGQQHCKVQVETEHQELVETRDPPRAQTKDPPQVDIRDPGSGRKEYEVESPAESDKEKSKSDEGATNSVPEEDTNDKDTNEDLGMTSLGLDEEQNWKRILSDQHVLPKILAFLQPKTILTLRLISREINNAVSQIIQLSYLVPQQTFNWGTIPHPTTFKKKLNIIQRRFDFSTVEKAAVFASRMIPQQGANSSWTEVGPNPFLSRFIVMHLDLSTEANDINETLLSLFGVHLWSLRFFGNEPISQFGLERFVLALNYVANLKTLSIRGRVLETVSQGWSSSCLPKLEHLSCLDVSNFRFLSCANSKFGVSIVMALIRTYGKQLESFYCNGEFLECPKISSEMLQDLLPSVKNLYVTEFTEVTLAKLSLVRKWRLKLLQLSRNERTWNFADFVPVLTTFSNSLMDLQLVVPLKNDWETTYPQLSPLLELRKLRVEIMSLRGRWFWSSLLPACVDLEELNFETIEGPSPNTVGIKHYTARARAKEAFLHMKKLEKVYIWISSLRNIIISRAEVSPRI